MTPPATRSAVRNVLVTLDDASSADETMQAAVNLAADLQAELQGIYVEDDALLRLAALPFVCEVTRGLGTVRPIDVSSMRRALRQKADQIRRELERSAELAHVRLSFEVASSTHRRHVRLSVHDADVQFFGSRGHAQQVRPPMGMRVRRRVRPLVVVLDASTRGDRLLTVAAVVARRHSRPIILMATAPDRATFDRICGAATELLCQQELAHTLLPHPIVTSSSLVHAARQQRTDLVMVGRTCHLLDESTLESLVEQLDCCLVLV